MPKMRPSIGNHRKRSLFINYTDSDDLDEDTEPDVADARGIAMTDSVLNWKVEDLAVALTLISQEIFQDLQPCDLKSLKWYNPRMKNQAESVRVNEITRRFNYDGQWTVREVLRDEVSFPRVLLLS